MNKTWLIYCQAFFCLFPLLKLHDIHDRMMRKISIFWDLELMSPTAPQIRLICRELEGKHLKGRRSGLGKKLRDVINKLKQEQTLKQKENKKANKHRWTKNLILIFTEDEQLQWGQLWVTSKWIQVRQWQGAPNLKTEHYKHWKN